MNAKHRQDRREWITGLVREHTGRAPERVEFYPDPQVDGIIAVRAWLEGEETVDLLVHHDRRDKVLGVEDVIFAAWPPTHSGGKPTAGPKYPHIVVKLIGTDGNAFAVMGAVNKALRKAGLGDEVVSEFINEATASDYNNLLETCMRWVTVE